LIFALNRSVWLRHIQKGEANEVSKILWAYHFVIRAIGFFACGSEGGGSDSGNIKVSSTITDNME
jgi:hypothetical protein